MTRVIFGTFTREDRWIITVDNERAKRELSLGFIRNGIPIVVRCYDVVVREEYRIYMRYQRIYESESGLERAKAALDSTKDGDKRDCEHKVDESLPGATDVDKQLT